MKTALGNARGSTLVISLVIMVVLMILTTGVYSITRAMVRESVYQMRVAQAQAIAEAGMEDALLQLRLSPGWRAGFTNKAFAGGSYTVTLSTDSFPWILSRGVSRPIANQGSTDVSVRAQAQWTSSNPCGTISDRDAVINGYMDAYSSSVSTAPASFNLGGRFCSNDGITVLNHGSPSLRMDVTYFGSPAPSASTVEGTVTRSTYTTTLTVHNGAAFASANSNNTLPAAYYTASNKRLVIPSNVAVTLYAGTYYFNTLTVSGNLRVNTSTGPVVIYMNNNLTLSTLAGAGNGEITNLSGIPSNLLIYPQGSRNMTFRSKAALHAIVDGSAATVTVRQTIYGNLRARNITIDNPYRFHFDLDTVTGGSPARVAWVMGSWTSTP